jgi:hypothetical protein
VTALGSEIWCPALEVFSLGRAKSLPCSARVLEGARSTNPPDGGCLGVVFFFLGCLADWAFVFLAFVLILESFIVAPAHSLWLRL